MSISNWKKRGTETTLATQIKSHTKPLQLCVLTLCINSLRSKILLYLLRIKQKRAVVPSRASTESILFKCKGGRFICKSAKAAARLSSRPLHYPSTAAQKKQMRKFGLKEFDLESVFPPLSPIHHITGSALWWRLPVSIDFFLSLRSLLRKQVLRSSEWGLLSFKLHKINYYSERDFKAAEMRWERHTNWAGVCV